MSQTYLYGHFAVVVSSDVISPIGSGRWKNINAKRVAILETNGHYIPTMISKRPKGVKWIVREWNRINYRSLKGQREFEAILKDAQTLAAKFEKAWPCCFLIAGWPEHLRPKG